jgi:hypothetical protein
VGEQVGAAKYVYGVVPASLSAPKTSGIARRRLQVVKDGNVAALVSDVPSDELEAGREDVMVHARVLERAQASGAVLPMRFGMVMPDADAIREQLLEPYAEELETQLHYLSDKAELHVQAVYEEQALMREVAEAHPEIRARSSAIGDRSPDASYYERIELGRLVAEAVESSRVADSEAILDALEPLADALEIAEPGHEREAARIFFLVEQARLGEFDAAVDELGRANEGRLRFKYTGPLPPYSFVALPGEG